MPAYNKTSYYNNNPITEVFGSQTTLYYCRDKISFWGDNSYNQLYNTSNLNLINAASIAAYDHTVVALPDGEVVAWGKNDKGQCNVPNGLRNVKSVSAGKAFTVALKENGTVVAWGDNSSGQCNIPSTATSVVAIAAGDNHVLAIKNDLSIIAWGSNFFGQSSIPSNIGKIANIAAGGDNSAVLLMDGSVYIWGSNINGNLNKPANLTNVSTLSIKSSHVLALKNDGTIVAWGNNNYGQITIPDTLTGNKIRKISAGVNFSLVLDYAGIITAWGDSSKSQTILPNLYQVENIAAGHSHSIASWCSIVPTPTPTKTVTPTPITPTPTNTQTLTPTVTPSVTPSMRVTNTPRPTINLTRTPTPTPTATPITTVSVTPTKKPHPSPFRKPVAPPPANQFIPPKPTQEALYFQNPSQTPTRTLTKTPTCTPTFTPTVTPTSGTPTPTPTVTKTKPTPTPTPTVTTSVGSYKNCAYPAFNGFQNTNNTYTTISLYKWDSCISTGNQNDGIIDSSKYFTSPGWNVDGHVTIVAITKTTGIVRESTGTFLSKYPIGSTQIISNVINLNNYPNVVSDTRRNGSGNIYCNNTDGSMNFVYLTNDYSKNCVPFGVNAPVYGVYHDAVDNTIYAVGSFTTVNSLNRNQVARFNYNGVYDQSFDVNQGYSGTPFDYPPNDIRRINDSLYISALQKFGTVGSNVLTFRSQNGLASNLHKVDLNGVRDINFLPFTFTFNNNNFIDYVSVPSQNLLILVNSRAISFRNINNNSQLSTTINGTDSIQGIVKPNEVNPSTVYILQKINGGISATQTPNAIKAINTTTASIDTSINNYIGKGMISTDNGGFAFGALSPQHDFMVLQRSYSDNNMTPGYWNGGTVNSPVLSKIYTSNFSIPNNTIIWNTYNHIVGANANNGNMLIDSNGRIYLVLLNETNYIFSNINVQPYSIIRLFPDGTYDGSFNVMANLNPSGKIYNAALISDFELIVCGDFTSYAGNASKQYIVKIDTNGNPINIM
jgi:alpha-tubulin suppressor-like RCC1 family protein